MTPTLNNTTRIADTNGLPTLEMIVLIAKLSRVIDEQATTIAAQQVTIADHEARITALEP